MANPFEEFLGPELTVAVRTMIAAHVRQAGAGGPVFRGAGRVRRSRHDTRRRINTCCGEAAEFFAGKLKELGITTHGGVVSA